jgi:hypothetical protein
MKINVHGKLSSKPSLRNYPDIFLERIWGATVTSISRTGSWVMNSTVTSRTRTERAVHWSQILIMQFNAFIDIRTQ